MSPLKSTLQGSFPDGLHWHDSNLLIQQTGKMSGWLFQMDTSTLEDKEIGTILEATAAKDIELEPVTRRSSLCFVEASKDQVCHIILEHKHAHSREANP